VNRAFPRWRPLIAFAVLLAAGLMALSSGLTQKADQALRAFFPVGVRDVLAVWEAFAAALLALCGWFGRSSWRKAAILAACGVAVLGFAALFARRGDYLPVGGVLLALAFSGLARLAYDLVYGAWRTEAARTGVRGRLCVMVFDVKGFVQRAGALPPEQSIALLNECFSAVTAAVHHRGGTASRLLGAGAVALFGAPEPLECPERSALEAAQDILESLRGIDPRLEAAIGLHAGEVAYGQVGGRRRQDYTALGPEVPVAAELQALAADLGEPVVCSAAVADAVGRAGGLRESGNRTVGGEQITLFAWTPPVLAGEPATEMKPA
jgi:class 3 adenylate cyclase